MAVKYSSHDQTSVDKVQAVYDEVAESYDDLWSRHVLEPNDRLTNDLSLKRGERLADLACGTGLFTVPMARQVTPGEIVCVDYSEGMLSLARRRALKEGLRLTLEHCKAEEFVESVPAASFDAVSMRFALAYLDWKSVLPRMGRMLRRGGRIGLLTSTSGSIPQAWEVYRKLTEPFGTPMLPSPMPDSADEVAELLARGGLIPGSSWNWSVRLWFADGGQAASWLRQSGYGTHPALGQMSEEALLSLEQLFAAGLEGFREDKGVPLDLVAAGVIARRPW